MFVFDDKIADEIVRIVKQEKGRPIPVKIICSKLKTNYNNKQLIYQMVDYLVDNGTLKKLFTQKIVMGYENGPILHETAFEGHIFLNTKGDGFVKKINNDTSEVYVNKKNINGALTGDKVVVCLMDKNSKPDNSLKDGVVLKVIERNKEFFSGLFVKKNNDYQVIFDDEKNKLKVILDDVNNLVNGHKILVKIKKTDNNIAFGHVVKIIGHVNDVGVDILSMVYDAGIEPEFSEAVNNEAKMFNKKIDLAEFAKRVDLTSLNIITIDPKTSKDLDDAIYVKEVQNNCFQLYVCIADVAHYVQPDSLTDLEAFKRSTSVYLVNQVIPMLPHNLSNDICSLNPNENRLSMVCEMLIDHQGNFLDIKVYNAVINSKRRFDYDEVNDFFNQTNSLASDTVITKNVLNSSLNLFKILKNKREKLGYIQFDIKEPKIILDDNQKIIDITIKKTGIAQNMIETFMVAANEAVTTYFKSLQLNYGFIYRVHEKPDEKKIAAFKIEAKKLNFLFDNEIHNIQPNTIAKWLKNNQSNPHQELINLILLRTMAKAKYDTVNLFHFGLALQNYTHFTSPIRRYSDLIVHRLFKMHLLNKQEYSLASKQALNLNLNSICEQTTKMEIVATNLERDVNSMKFAEYMENKINQKFSGFASYITNFGVFVQLDNTIEGLAKPENIKGDFFEFNEEGCFYFGKKSQKKITLGTKVIVNVIGANKVNKKIDFEIIQFN